MTKNFKRLSGILLAITMIFAMTILGALTVSAADVTEKAEDSGTYDVTFSSTELGWNSTAKTLDVTFGAAITDITFDITCNPLFSTLDATQPTTSAKVASSDGRVVSAKLVEGKIRLVARAEGDATITLTVAKKTGTKTVEGADGTGSEGTGKKTTVTKYTYDATEFTFDVTVAKAPTAVDETNFNNYIVTFKTQKVADTSNGADQNLVIDFANEKAVADAAIVAYSTNGGTKWNKLKEPIKKGTDVTKGTDISKLLDKGGDLVFTTKLDEKGKLADGGATIWYVGTVNARPKSPKLTPFYGLFNDDGLVDGTVWTIAVNGSVPDAETLADPDADTILFATAFGDGKTVDKPAAAKDNKPWTAKFGFSEFIFEDGYPVAKLAKAEDKPETLVYLAKIAPVVKDTGDTDADTGAKIYEFAAGTKPVSLKVAGEQKPIMGKVDYTKETLTLKAGAAYYFTGAKDEDDKAADPDIGLTVGAANAKSGIPFKGEDGVVGIIDQIPSGEKYQKVKIWQEANGKKPRSMQIEIYVYDYIAASGIKAADITAGIKNAGTDKVSFKLPKGYQVRETADDAWGTMISPTLKEDDAAPTGEQWQVRKLGTAKFDAKNIKTWITNAKELTTVAGKLTFNYKAVKTGTAKEDNIVTHYYLNAAKIEALGDTQAPEEPIIP